MRHLRLAHQAGLSIAERLEKDLEGPYKDQDRSAEELIAAQIIEISERYRLHQEILESPKEVTELEVKPGDARDANAALWECSKELRGMVDTSSESFIDLKACQRQTIPPQTPTSSRHPTSRIESEVL